MNVFLARPEHLEELAKLFDQYRVFYKQPSDLEAATKFLQARFQNGDSTIFVASDGGSSAAFGRLIGFTQLYPSFSSALMRRSWILNDLFVDANFRRQGVAKLLMNAAKDFARETNAVRLTLATQTSNTAAQALYESMGYVREEAFYQYTLQL